jgi:hypothetical protein
MNEKDSIFFIFIRLQKVHKNDLGFAHPAFTSHSSCNHIQQMDLLSLVLCSIFVQSLDFELGLTSFDTFIISLFITQSYPLHPRG